MFRLANTAQSLGARLVLATLGFCLLFTLLTIGVLTYSAWNSGLAKMNAELAQIEQVYSGTLSKAIWELDRESLQTHVMSATRVPAVGRIVLKITLANRAAELIEGSSRDDWSGQGRAPIRRLVLHYEPYPGARETVGELTLYGSEHVLWERLRTELTTIVFTQLLQSLMLAGLIMLMFNRLVTVHVQRIAAHLARLGPNNLNLELGLLRGPGHRDELTALVSGINGLQSSMVSYLAQQQQYEQELAGHRDRLAQLVHERTNELQTLASAQQVVLTQSNRLIHAPYTELDRYHRECLGEVAQQLHASQVVWYVLDPARQAYLLFVHWSVPDTQQPADAMLPMAAVAGLWALLEQEELLHFSSPEALARRTGGQEAALFARLGWSVTAFSKLRGNDEQPGFLVFAKPAGLADWKPSELTLLSITTQMLLQSVRHQKQLGDIMQAQTALQTANTRLQSLARTDPLTGLANRRHFDEVKEEEFRRARRNGQCLSFLICDIDYFKNYNDHYGHAMGDHCLRAVADTMRASLARAGDMVARIGGEEFGILLPDADETTARMLAQRVRQAVAECAIVHAHSQAAAVVTISIGLAVHMPGQTESFEDLFRDADQALYRAKANGRNQVAGPIAIPANNKEGEPA